MHRAPLLPEAGQADRLRARRGGDIVERRSDLLPEILVDDAPLRHVLDDPGARRIGARAAFCWRVLDEALPVPDQLSGMECNPSESEDEATEPAIRWSVSILFDTGRQNVVLGRSPRSRDIRTALAWPRADQQVRLSE